MMKNLVYIGFAVFVLIQGVSTAAPTPAIVQIGNDWTVDVKYEHPQQIAVRDDPSSKSGRYWYTIITLTNNIGRDVDFYPKCDLMTDTFKIVPAGRKTPAKVFEKIKARHQSKYPFLESLEKTDNKILQGKDNTKDIAIIWPDFDPKAKNIKLFVAGLSNETVVIDHPVAKDENGGPKKVYLRKSLELSYALGGDPAFRDDLRLTVKGKRWVMR